MVGGNPVTDVRKPEISGYDVIVGGELFTGLSDHPRKLVTLNPNSNQQAPDATSFFPVGGCLPQAAWPERFSPKSQDAVALQQIKERGALPMIDRGDIRQAIDRCSNIWASLPGAGYGRSEHKADSLISQGKIQRSGRKRSERLMYEQSHRDYLLPGYLHHRLPVMANHYRDNAITYKAQRDKNARRTGYTGGNY